MTSTNNNHVLIFEKKENSKPVSIMSEEILKRAAEVRKKYKPTGWIKLNHETKENYPPSGEVVLVALRSDYNGKLYREQAYYIAPKTREEDFCNEYELDTVYDEEKDVFYWPEGWYESSWESDVNWIITTAKVEYWMKWPELPVED